MNCVRTVPCALLLAALSAHAQGIITTVAGNGTHGFSGDGGPATNASLWFPMGVAVDKAGNVYIADHYNMRIRKVSASGIITTFAGNGVGDFSGDHGPAASASLWFPMGVAVDTESNVYVGDSENHRIRRVNNDGKVITVAGGGPCCSLGDGGSATRATLRDPTGVSMDPAGNIYIADTRHYRVRKVSRNGIIATVAGYGVSAFNGDGGLATTAGLSADWVVADAMGNVYITDSSNARIRKVTPSGTIITFAGGGPCCSPGDGGPATQAFLNNPRGLALDTAGNLYITEAQSGRIRKVTPGGIISTVAGGGTLEADGVPATSAFLFQPWGVAVDSVGNLYISDTGNNRVRKVTFP